MLVKDLFKHYNYLGYFNPYYLSNKHSIQFKSHISDILKIKNDPNILNIAAVISLLSKGYVIGDNTLIQTIKKTPWMTKHENEEWIRYKELKMGDRVVEQDKIVEDFFKLIIEEIVYFIGKKKRIGILLSGGMDSRIVAGALDFIITNGILDNLSVIAFTWGDKESRDVNYSREIATSLGWDWKHFDISSEDILHNIEVTAQKGCEYSPIHLHGMMKVREVDNIDCILAGSFGDSVGRGEYSGKNITELKSIDNDISNNFQILKIKKELFNKSLENIRSEITNYWKLFPQNKDYQQCEQDYQIHYMRRMLNPCMSLINEKIELNQVFTSPKLVNFIWSLHPRLRNNELYKGIFKKVNKKLSNIPWARTGLLFDEVNGSPQDNFYKSSVSNIYLNAFNSELFDYVKGLVLSDSLESLEIFNSVTLKNSFKALKMSLFKNNINLVSRLLWLASLSMFIEKYDIRVNETIKSKNNITNTILGYQVFIENGKHTFKEIYRDKFLNIS